MILFTKISDPTRQRGHTLLTCTVLTQVLGILCSPASLLFSRLSVLAATKPTLSCLRFFLFSPKSLPFPTWHPQLVCGFLRFSTSLPPSPILSSFPSLFPSSSPFPSPLLLSFPSPLPSPFLSCASPYASTPVPVPVPDPSQPPSLFTSSFPPPPPPPPPFPSLFLPPTPIPPPTPFAPSRPSDPVIPLVRCAFTGTRSYKRRCRVPTSATPCLQRW